MVLAVVPVVVVSVAVEGVASGGGERAGVAWGGSRGKNREGELNWEKEWCCEDELPSPSVLQSYKRPN